MNWAELSGYLFWWFVFGLIHSIFANHQIKAMIPAKGKIYRVIYNIVATVILLAILINEPSITSLIKSGFELKNIRFIAFIFTLALGCVIAILGLLAWDLLAFIGLKTEINYLNKGGIYAFCRHPVYTGAILAFLSVLTLGITAETVSWLLGAGGYFIIGSFFEERNLGVQFEEYQLYKNEVGRFFPWKKGHLEYMKKSIKSRN